MNKEKRSEWLAFLKEKLAFLKPWDLDDEVGEELQIREMYISKGQGNSRAGRWDTREENPQTLKRRRRFLIAILCALAVCVVIAFISYGRTHLFTDYLVTSTVENLDIYGTDYAVLNKNIIKYSSDGVFCVDYRNQTEWSAAYSMQTPIVDSCEKTMVIAEQQGDQIYVLNTEGILGSFRTDLPIIKVRVSRQGVVAAILKDKEATWIRLYNVTGTEIARIKATLQDSGYPLDVAMTPDAKKMMVSYLGESGGKLRSRIAFYDFSSASDQNSDHMTGMLEYSGRVFPSVYYADPATPVALANDGFVVLKNKSVPQVEADVEFDREIVSSFHDERYVGFVFNNASADCRYEMEAYRYNGKRSMKHEFDCDYSEIKLDDGEILLYNAKSLTVVTLSGNERFATDYEKQAAFFSKIRGYRKYLVITDDSMDRIRIE